MAGDHVYVRGGKVYYLRPYRDPWGLKSNLKWIAFDAHYNRVGAYRTRKEFERDLDLWHAREGLSAQQLQAVKAEEKATVEGLLLLEQVIRRAKFGR